MRRMIFLLCTFLMLSICSIAQQKEVKITGKLTDDNAKAITGATVSLLRAKDSSLIKAEITDETGSFTIVRSSITDAFIILYTSIGFNPLYSRRYDASSTDLDLGSITLKPVPANLQNITVSGKRPVVEIKADKMVFNVENSINATGSNAMELLQKSPGVLVDNNDNISMKGKTGVRVYIDGKMMVLGSQDLAAYLKSINSSDIEAIEMINNPGARYDASGNAGIINIRLKKNKKYGTNGNLSLGVTQGITPKGNASIGLNHRNKKWNLFSNLSVNKGRFHNNQSFYRVQRDSLYDQVSSNYSNSQGLNAKIGGDFYLNKRNTFGFMLTTNFSENDQHSTSKADISYNPVKQYVKTLLATNHIPQSRTNINANLNYRYVDTTGKEISTDVDYGVFRGAATSYQPNNYIDKGGNILSRVVNRNNTPTDIDIFTAKVDVEMPKWKGKFGYGAKLSYVKTDNLFDFFNDVNGAPVRVLSRSNQFEYIENVNAAYVNYQRVFNERWSMQSGLRLEQTNSKGVLTRMDGIIQGDNTVQRSYLNAFPSAAISLNADKQNTINLTFSRRIDRPTYQDLNPFENKLDELTYEKGNAFLRPQYTNSVELQHTWKQLLTTTLGYSYVSDFSTITTDTIFNATYIQQKNLARQQIWNIAVGSALPIAPWWNGYANVYFNYQMYNGMVGEKSLNMKVPVFGAYMQHTLSFAKVYAAEISGWFSGPSVWGGTWRSRPQGGLDLGIQKQLFEKKATLKLSVTDIFFTNPWVAVSDFGGLYIRGRGNWESRTLRLNFTWRFGKSEARASQRKSGMESESQRIKG